MTETHYYKLTAVLAGSPVAKYAWTAFGRAFHESEWALQSLYFAMQASAQLHQPINSILYDVFHNDSHLGPEEIKAAQQELIEFAAGENLKYRTRGRNEVQLNLEDGVNLGYYVDIEFIQDVQRYFEECDIRGLQIEINIRQG